MAASPIIRYGVPVGATFLFQGSILADGKRPSPAAVYAEPSITDADLCESVRRASMGSPGCKPQKPCDDTELERLVMSARQNMGPYKETVMCYVNEGIKQVSFYYDKLLANVCYLRTGAPQEVRIGTVVAGGLTGMLLGIRGGAFKKLFMGTLGTGGGAYLAYPYETEKYTKKYTAIAYNFIAGPPPNQVQPKCDSPVSRRQAEKQSTKCGKGSEPEALPNWLRCPPNLMQRSYPVPDGVDILPISQGGRNGPAGGKSNKKQFKCGQCGEEAAPKPQPRPPNAPADCPMMKARGCAGIGDKNEGKGGSLFERIKNFFGIGKEDSRLSALSKKLKDDEQIRHHRDVFDTRLMCRKDGYFAPLLTKVDCQGKPGCTCGNEDVDEEELDEEYYEEEDDDEEYYEDLEDEEYDEDDSCEDEDGALDVQLGADGGGEKVENMICLCNCNGEEPGGGGEGGQAGVGGTAKEEEEECVEDKEGECIIEESAECMDPECKFFLEDPADRKKPKKADFSKVGVTPDTDCLAMNNFIIRVQAPFSEKTTNETVEQIIARLTNKKPEYPEPGPKPEKEKKEESGAPDKEDLKLVVKQICVEEPTCECPPVPWPCKKKDCKKEKVADSNLPSPPPNEPPPSFRQDEEPPPYSEDECEDIPPAPQEKYEAPPPLPSDCETLSEEELLRKPIKDITCGCPKSSCSSDAKGACYGMEASVWVPPPPPPCPRCSAPQRGVTEDCYLCQLTRRMRSGLPEIQEKPPMTTLKIVRQDPGSCVPEYLPDGSMKYKGGMCLNLAGSYIWHTAKRTPPGGFFDRYTGECGEEARLQALTGTKSYAEAFSACYNRNTEGMKWRGGTSIENSNRFLWGLPFLEEEMEKEEEKRVCKKPTKSEAPSSKDKCPAPPKK